MDLLGMLIPYTLCFHASAVPAECISFACTFLARFTSTQFKAGTWRVGGLLALSRAFGDAYLKVSKRCLYFAVL